MVKIAALKDGEVINIYNYSSMKETEKFFKKGAFGDADSFKEIDENSPVYIGWRLVDGEWEKPAEPDEYHRTDPMFSPTSANAQADMTSGVSNDEIMKMLLEIKEKLEGVN